MHKVTQVFSRLKLSCSKSFAGLLKPNFLACHTSWEDQSSLAQSDPRFQVVDPVDITYLKVVSNLLKLHKVRTISPDFQKMTPTHDELISP